MVVRKRDWILAPHQCEKFWFVHLCGCCPDSDILADTQKLAVLNRANLDIFWTRDTSTIHGMFGYGKELVRRDRGEVRAFPLPTIPDWTVVNEVGMGVAIHMSEKSLSNKKNGRNYLQFNIIRQL